MGEVPICSRELSRTVKSYINMNMFEVQDFDKYSVPLSCPIHPLADPYYNQEKNWMRVSVREYQCMFCKKKFKSLYYMDRHMDNKHKDMLVESENTYCLAELCQIFGCKPDDLESHKKGFNNLQVCRRKDIDNAKKLCHELVDM